MPPAAAFTLKVPPIVTPPPPRRPPEERAFGLPAPPPAPPPPKLPGVTPPGVPPRPQRPPGPVPPQVPVPGGGTKYLVGGDRTIRRPPNEPFVIPVEVSVITTAVFLAARRAFGSQVRPEPGEQPLPVDSRLVRPPLSEEEVRRQLEIQQQRQRLRDFAADLDDLLFGKVEGSAGAAAAGARGLLGKQIASLLTRGLVGGEPAGHGEEQAMGRANEAMRRQWEYAVTLALSVLPLGPPRAGGVGAVVTTEQEKADP